MGKGGSALSLWIREFTALVFTQSIQAFIYAVIISVILYGMTSKSPSASTNSALGMMSVFALLSVFKVEEMSKKIFGFPDTKASPGNAMKSIAKTAFAVQLGKRVLDNVGKVTGGLGKIGKAGKTRAGAKSRLDEDAADNGFELKDGKYTYTGKSKNTGNIVVPQGSGGNRPAGNGGGNGNAGGSGDVGNIDVDIPNIPVASAGDTAYASDAARRRMREALRRAEDERAKANEMRNEGIKDIFSGLTETLAAPVGAATGAVLAGADGNIDELLQGLVAGAGAGDAVGEATVNALSKAVKNVNKMAKHKPGMSNKEFKAAIDDLTRTVQSQAYRSDASDAND